jgi:hypothetical protein
MMRKVILGFIAAACVGVLLGTTNGSKVAETVPPDLNSHSITKF